MPKLLIFRGPPATGKSTRRNELVQQGWAYVNKDELRIEYPNATEREIHERLMQRMHEYTESGLNIINDNTNLNPKTVNEYIAWAQRRGYDSDVVSFGRDVSVYEAIRRDENRSKPVGRSVIIKMYVDAGLYPTEHDRSEVVLFDVDGTLADCSHRVHYVRNTPKNWKKFFDGMELDALNKPIADLYHTLSGYYPTIIMSGRPANYQLITERWLHAYGIHDYHAAFFRNYNDSRNDAIVKRELYEKYVAPYFTVKYVVDDRASVCDMWRSLGLTVLQVAKGDF